VDLVVGSLERSLPFYRGLLEPIGWSDHDEIVGERGEAVHYLSVPGSGVSAIGLRQAQSDPGPEPYDRYSIGLHHVCIDVINRDAVDERAEWIADSAGRLLSPPAEYGYTPGYYAVFFADPDGIKLELLHRPTYWQDSG
jgi:catechol 2,3-dioxygenase-like lactoylglutathione lyase family enzyme